MKENIFKDYNELSEAVADQVIKQIKNKPDSLITIAGGETPLGTLQILSNRLLNEDIDYSKVTFVSLDEWVSLNESTVGSCRESLNTNLFDSLNLTDEQVVFFDGDAENLTDECKQIDDVINRNDGLDLIILGIGMNGHLGFNEPGIITRKSSIVKLADVTKQVMNKYFDEELKLTHGITLGYEQILASKKIVLMANGARKANIIQIMKDSEISYDVPASILKDSNNFELYIDEEARRLNEKD